jgi:hypothetical protein
MISRSILLLFSEESHYVFFTLIIVSARAFSALPYNNKHNFAVSGGSPDEASYFTTRHASATEPQAAVSNLQRRCLFRKGVKKKIATGLPGAIKMFTNADKVFYFVINKFLCNYVDDINLQIDK